MNKKQRRYGFASVFYEFIEKLLTSTILRDMMYCARRSIVPNSAKPQGKENTVDIQLKRGLLDVCVLSAIKSEESYGYKIIKDMKPYIEMSESTLYTILKRLELSEMLTVRTAEHGGRLRKYYKITKAGLGRIEDFKDEWREVMAIYQFVMKEDGKND